MLLYDFESEFNINLNLLDDLAIISEGSVRKNALYMMIGALLFLLGNASDVPSIAKLIAGIQGLPEIAQITAPPLQIIGAIMIQRGFPRTSY